MNKEVIFDQVWQDATFPIYLRDKALSERIALCKIILGEESRPWDEVDAAYHELKSVQAELNAERETYGQEVVKFQTLMDKFQQEKEQNATLSTRLGEARKLIESQDIRYNEMKEELQSVRSEVPEIANEIADVISGFKANKGCRICHGKAGWHALQITLNEEKEKVFTLQRCCGTVGDTEYIRLSKRLQNMEQRNRVQHLIQNNFTAKILTAVTTPKQSFFQRFTLKKGIPHVQEHRDSPLIPGDGVDTGLASLSLPRQEDTLLGVEQHGLHSTEDSGRVDSESAK